LIISGKSQNSVCLKYFSVSGIRHFYNSSLIHQRRSIARGHLVALIFDTISRYVRWRTETLPTTLALLTFGCILPDIHPLAFSIQPDRWFRYKLEYSSPDCQNRRKTVTECGSVPVAELPVTSVTKPFPMAFWNFLTLLLLRFRKNCPDLGHQSTDRQKLDMTREPTDG